MHTPAPPQLTPAQLLRAFEAMHWTGWTFDAAMDNDMRHRLVICRALQLHARETRAATQPTTQCVRRVRLDAQGNVAGWCTQAVMGPRQATPQLELIDKADTP